MRLWTDLGGPLLTIAAIVVLELLDRKSVV